MKFFVGTFVTCCWLAVFVTGIHCKCSCCSWLVCT